MRTQEIIDVANYIESNVHLTRNMVLNIYKDNGKLYHTLGSLEYRDKELLITLRTMDEAPENIKAWVEFTAKNK